MRDDTTLLYAAAIVAAIVIPGAWISYKSGAAFDVSLAAFWQSIFFGAMIIYGAGKLLNWGTMATTAAAAAFIWPLWWPVLESAAVGGSDAKQALFQTTEPWWNDAIFRWGIELVLLAIASYFIYQRLQNPYRY